MKASIFLLAGLLFFNINCALAATTLDTMVVSATRVERSLMDVPVRTEVVSRHELDKTHARSLKEALENVPGLQLREIHGKSGYEASLQGMSSDQLLILIDGMPLAASTGSSVDLSQYALTDVERIEIIKGAASAQYGSSAMGGVINIITRNASSGLRGSISYDAGSYGKQNINQKNSSIAQHHANALLEGGSKTLKGRLSADLRDNRGFDANPNNWSRQGDDSQLKQYTGQLHWQPLADTYISLEGQHFSEEDQQWLAEDNGRFPNKHESIRRNRINLNTGTSWDNGAALSVKTLLERYQSDSYKQNLGYIPFDTRVMQLDTNFISMQLDLPSLGSHQWQLGVDARNETLQQNKDGVAEIGSDGSADRQNYEVFVQDDYFFSRTGELVLGLRLQDDSDFGFYASPKAALKIRLFDQGEQQLLFRASAGTGYRVPNLKERYYTFDHSSIGYKVMGNANLKPESSLSYQTGIWWQISQQRSIDINAFYNDISDLIQTDEDNATVVDGVSIYSYRNIDQAETYGLESVYQDQLTHSLNFNISHTYTKTRNKKTGAELTQKPQHIARLGIDWQLLNNWNIGLRARYQAKELASTSPAAWSPAWTTFDLKSSVQITPNLRGFGGIDNLTNKQRDFSTGTDFGPITGRFVYLGLQLQTNFF